jgi:hypothetical protein
VAIPRHRGREKAVRIPREGMALRDWRDAAIQAG